MNVWSYWASAPSGLTSLVPQSSVYLDIPANTLALPYVVLSQVGQPSEWNTSNNRVSRLKLNMIVYAKTLTAVDAICAQIKSAFNWQTVTSAGFGCRLDNTIPRGEVGSAYSCVLTYTLFENISTVG